MWGNSVRVRCALHWYAKLFLYPERSIEQERLHLISRLEHAYSSDVVEAVLAELDFVFTAG